MRWRVPPAECAALSEAGGGVLDDGDGRDRGLKTLTIVEHKEDVLIEFGQGWADVVALLQRGKEGLLGGRDPTPEHGVAHDLYGVVMASATQPLTQSCS
jgi:hypothetical protein